jgi:hypothetical protein
MARIKVTYEFEDTEGYYGTHKTDFSYLKGQNRTITDPEQAICLQNISDDLRGMQNRYREMAFDSTLRELKEPEVEYHKDHSDWLNGLIKTLDTLEIIEVQLKS